MRGSLLILLAGALLLPAGAHAASDRSPEAELARTTAGRTAGPPADCIYQRDIQSTRIINRTAIVYTMNNGTIYVNRPKSGATSLSPTDVMVTDTHSPQLCSIDIVTLVDSAVHMRKGSVGLDKFVPYPRPSAKSR